MGVSLFDILRKQDEERENVKAVENGESYSAASNATAEPAANTELSSSEKNDETKENEFLSDGEAESFGLSTVENSNSTATETSENPFESFGSEFSEMPETEMPKDFGGDAPAEAVVDEPVKVVEPETEDSEEFTEEVTETPANEAAEEPSENQTVKDEPTEKEPFAKEEELTENENVTASEKPAEVEQENVQPHVQTSADAYCSDDLKEQFRLRKFATFASKIDLDCTMPNLSSSEIADRAEQAKLFGLASVCTLASRMRMFKKQSAEQVFCAVIAYPSGEMTEKSKICEIREAKSNGAKEIDVFFRISALKDEKRKNIIKSLKKYRFVIGKKNVFKLSIDSLLITNEEAEFIVEAATAAKVDYLVVRNCALNDERTKLFFSGLCAGKLKLEFSDCIINLSSAEKLSAIGTDKFLLHDALAVAATMRDEINKE